MTSAELEREGCVEKERGPLLDNDKKEELGEEMADHWEVVPEDVEQGGLPCSQQKHWKLTLIPVPTGSGRGERPRGLVNGSSSMCHLKRQSRSDVWRTPRSPPTGERMNGEGRVRRTTVPFRSL